MYRRAFLFNRTRTPYTLKEMSTLLYRDSTMIIVSKPAGQPVQSKRKEVESVPREWRRKLRAEIRDSRHIQAVHRIDQPVSGAVVLSLESASIPLLSDLFRNGHVRRWYLAVVDRPPPSTEGELIDAIATDAHSNRSVIRPDGKSARLTYRMFGRTDHHSVLLVRLDTGRHHQIRVQLAAHGMHVVGDAKYGARRALRDRSIALHAWRISIPSPYTQIPITITAPLPTSSLWRAVGALLVSQPELDRVDDRMEEFNVDLTCVPDPFEHPFGDGYPRLKA